MYFEGICNGGIYRSPFAQGCDVPPKATNLFSSCQTNCEYTTVFFSHCTYLCFAQR